MQVACCCCVDLPCVVAGAGGSMWVFSYIYLQNNCAFECIYACSEANDMAMMMARLYTHNHDIITLRNAYHGLSGGRVGGRRLRLVGVAESTGCCVV